MGSSTSIEWTESTWNPWQGCKKVSPGCLNCYMYRTKKRFGQNPNEIIRSSDTTFASPLKWKQGRLIFTCSWSDWFIEEADIWREEGWDIIRQCPKHTFQILTKRPERIQECLPHDWNDGWDNVWLGVSIENQEYISRLDILCGIPAKIRFISAEPLLGPIHFGDLSFIDWVITGGESGPGYRPTRSDWLISIRDTCIGQGIPFFHKQNGGTRKIDSVWGGKKLDGQIWDCMPKRIPERKIL